MSTPWFFLSYATVSPKQDRQVEEFFADLVEAMRATAPLKANECPDEDIGFCAPQISQGTNWGAELCQKLNSCRVLVCLYSEAYLQSKQCGREFTIFQNRLNEYPRAKGVRPPDLIIPVIWRKNFDERKLPAALKSIQYKNSGSEDTTNQEGVYYYLEIQNNKGPKYYTYVDKLAKTITEAGRLKPPLPCLTNAIDFETTESAFEAYTKASPKQDEVIERSGELQTKPTQIDFSAKAISLTKIKLQWKTDESVNVTIERRMEAKGEFRSIAEVDIGTTEYVDSGLRPFTTYVYQISASDNGNRQIRSKQATVTTRSIPVHWYITVASAFVIMATLAFSFRCALSPRFCEKSAIPLPISEGFTDRFERKADGAPGWLKEANWDYPANYWSTVPGRDGDPVDRALLVRGVTPGFTKDAFDNFEASFRISHLEGKTVGWFLRAQKKDGKILGYRFVLEKRSDNTLFLYVSDESTPSREISPPGCNVPIYEYKKRPNDDIEVKVKAIGNEITYSFQLSNPNAGELPDTLPVRCDEPFKDGSKSFIDAGHVGFFADADSVFKVEDLFVRRMK
jgi:hypothetical protein